MLNGCQYIILHFQYLVLQENTKDSMTGLQSKFKHFNAKVNRHTDGQTNGHNDNIILQATIALQFRPKYGISIQIPFSS